MWRKRGKSLPSSHERESRDFPLRERSPKEKKPTVVWGPPPSVYPLSSKELGAQKQSRLDTDQNPRDTFESRPRKRRHSEPDLEPELVIDFSKLSLTKRDIPIDTRMEESRRKRDYGVAKLEALLKSCIADLNKNPPPSKRQFANHVTKIEKELENVDGLEEALLTIDDSEENKLLNVEKPWDKLGYRDNPISLFDLTHKLLNELQEKEESITEADRSRGLREHMQELFGNIDVKKDLLTKTVNHVMTLLDKEESPGITRWMDKLDTAYSEVQTMVLKVIKSREDLQTLDGHTKEEWTTLLDTLIREQADAILIMSY